MTGRYKAKSKYIKEKIKKTKFSDREYIDNLIFLEKSITDGIHGWAGNMKLHSLKSTYEKDYIKLLKELAPENLGKFLKEKKKSKKEERDVEEYFKRKEEKERKDWIKAGGILDDDERIAEFVLNFSEIGKKNKNNIDKQYVEGHGISDILDDDD